MGSRAEIIFELLDEIKQMEDTVLYFQNKILRKRIAIQEILNGAEVKSDIPTDDQPKNSDGRLAYGIWNDFLKERNGDEFTRQDVIAFAKRVGCSSLSIPVRVSGRIHQWLSTGQIRRTGHQRYAKNG